MSYRTALSPLLFAIPAWCAGVSGLILDPQARAISGASVALFARSGAEPRNTTSDASGHYRFGAVASGVYVLRSEAPGFSTFVSQDVLISGTADFAIHLALAQIKQELVVTATGTAQTGQEIGKTVTVIDRADAVNRNQYTAAGAVDLSPGVRVQQLGGPGQVTSIRIRGLRAQDTSVLVDGLRLRDPGAIQADASSLLGDLLFTNTSRAEVMNGPGSSLYGTTAIGGVVNILTDEGGGRTRGEVEIEGGSLGTVRGRAQVAGAGLHDHLQYSAGLAYVNVMNGVDGHDAFRDTSFQGRMQYRWTKALSLSARLFAADAFAQLNTSPEQTGVLPAGGIVNAVPFVTFRPGANDPDSTRAGRFLSGALVLAGELSERLNYSFSAQSLASGRRYGDGPAGQGFQPFGNQRTLYDGRVQTVNAQLHYLAGRAHLFSGGYEFEREAYGYDFSDRSDASAASGIHASQRSHAVFLQDQAKFLDGRLQLTGGFRAQYFALGQPLFSPVGGAPYVGVAISSPPAAYTGDGAAAYFFRRANTKLHAHVGRGYRAPSLYERFGAGFDSFYGYSAYGDPRLQPEHSLGFDGGVEQWFAHSKARVSAGYFYTRLDRVVGFTTLAGSDPFGRFFGYTNTAGGLSRGAEFSASLAPIAQLRINAAYTFVNAIEQAPLVGNTLRTFVIPRHQFSAMAVWSAGQRLTLTFDTLQSGNYLAPIFAFPATRVYSFAGLRRVNAQAGYRLPLGEFRAARFFARGENLTGQDYFESGFRTPGRTAMAGVRFEF